MVSWARGANGSHRSLSPFVATGHCSSIAGASSAARHYSIVHEFAVGQYVELLVTHSTDDLVSRGPGTPSRWGSVEPCRGVVRAREDAGSEEGRYLVELLWNEAPTGETLWMRAIEMLPA